MRVLSSFLGDWHWRQQDDHQASASNLKSPGTYASLAEESALALSTEWFTRTR